MLTYVPKNTGLRRQVPHHRREGQAQRARASARARATSPCARRPARRCSASRRRRWPCSIARSCRTTSRCGRCRCASRTPIGPAWRRCSSPCRRRGVTFKAVPDAEAPGHPTSSSSPASRTSSGHDDREAVAALSAAGPDRPAGQRQDGRGALLPRAGPRRRASTRSRRWSTTRWPTRPSVRIATVDISEREAGGPAREQPRRGAAGREGSGGPARPRQPALRRRAAADAIDGRAVQQGADQGAALLLRRLPGEGRDADGDAVAAERRQAAGRGAAGAGARPMPRAGFRRSAGSRSTRSSPGPTSCASP